MLKLEALFSLFMTASPNPSSGRVSAIMMSVFCSSNSLNNEKSFFAAVAGSFLLPSDLIV